MSTEQTRYREFTPWSGVARAILWAVVLLACYASVAGWDEDVAPHLGLAMVGLVFAITGAVIWIIAGLTVEVQESRIVMHLGRLPVIRGVVPFDEIVSLRSVEYRPIREFGGWGLRGSGRRRAWTARGKLAVAIELKGNRELLIGSDHPKRLEERIRTLAGIHVHD